MKSKVIDLFGSANMVQNNGVKYSSLLEQFLTPFVKDLEKFEFYEEIIEFGIAAWNFGNMSSVLPEKEGNAILEKMDEIHDDLPLLKKMIEYKVQHFKSYTNFIVDYELEETIEDPILHVVTQMEDDYLSGMFDNSGEVQSKDEFEENFINRSAVFIKPLQPFLLWISKLYPEDENNFPEVTTYLINGEIENIEQWLKKNYDKIFTFELEGMHTDKKEWPQKRTYKMFKEWFTIDYSTLVYDLEKAPVSKSDI